MEDSQDRRVYVGNLPYSVKEQQLKEFVGQVGEPTKAYILTTSRGLSRGCGIVEFETAQQAQEAIEKLNSQTIDGRIVYVREDREQSLPGSSPAGGAPGAAPAGQGAATRQRGTRFAAPTDGTTVFFGNLPWSVAWQDLKDFARSAGPVVRADVPMGPNRRSRGYGTVVYETTEAAEKAIETLNGQQIQERTIEVRHDRPSAERFAERVAATAPAAPAVGASTSAFAAASGHGPASAYIHVSNLPWQTTSNDLVELFETIDRVERAEIQLLADGRMSGNGVVQFADQRSADMAVRSFNGYLYGGLNIVVSFARYPPS